MRTTSLLLLTLGLLCLTPPHQAAFANDASSVSEQQIQTITASDLQKLLKAKKTSVLVDVREQDEYAQGHIDGAKLMPLGTIIDHLNEIPKNKKIVVYCRSGRRSAKAVTLLQSHGYTNVVSLSGGFQEWSDLQDAKKKEMRVCSSSVGCKN